MSRQAKTIFPVAILAVLLALFFSLVGEAQQNKKAGPAPRARIQGLKPQVTRAVKVGESVALRTLPATRNADLASLEEMERREINRRNTMAWDRVRSPWAPPNQQDAAISGTRQGVAAPLGGSVTPPVIGSFDALADTDNGVAGLGLVNPPDTNADVSFTQIVETVNSVFRVFAKDGTPLTPVLKQSDLFDPLGGQCAAADPGDPIVLYDRMADRWQISQFNFSSSTTPPYHQCVAISKTNDAAGEYYLYDFITPGNDFPDYPKLGVWSDGYYMSTRQFTFGASFNGLGAFAFNRLKMIAGDPTAELIFFPIPFDATYPSGTSSGIIPTDHDGLLPPPPGSPNIFAIYDSDEFGVADEVHLFDFHADFETPANSTFMERPESPIPVPAFNDDEPSGRADIEEPSPGENLDSIPDRLMFRLSYRNLDGIESLVTNHTVNVSGVPVTNAATYQAASRYYEFRKTVPGGPYTVYDAATYAPDPNNGATGTNRWMGSTAIDNQGNLAMGFSASSTTLFPSIRYVGRTFDGSGATLGSEVTLFAGLGTQSASGNRWGDYTSMSVDPSDDCTFWYANEYYPVGNTGFNWRTRIGSFKFPTCSTPAQGTLSGTMTACASGAPIGEVLITVTGGPSEGFSSSTADDGTYSMQLAPGNYTVVASSGIRGCEASASANVTITDGGTATFSTCLSGSGILSFPEFEPAPATVSGGDGDGQIEPSECNTVDVKVQNIGCAPATGVVGTLSTTTPGVLITQATSSYADLPIDAIGTNLTPFEVSTSSAFSCGTPINFTLTLTYAGGGSNVLNFTLNTCQGPTVTVMGSLTGADPVQEGRLGRNGVASSCGIAKACPGIFGAGNRRYDVLNFVNGPAAACATITTTVPGGAGTPVVPVAYLNSYTPPGVGTGGNICINYLGDAGASPNTVNSFSVDVPASATLVVVIQDANAGQADTPYSVQVSGLVSNTTGNGACALGFTTQVSASNITLGQSVFDTAMLSKAFSPVGGNITFNLYGPDDSTCSGAPVFTSVETVVGNGSYSSNPFVPSAPGVYRWTASYSGSGLNPPAASVCNDPNETVVVSLPPTPTPTPSPTPSPTPGQALNLSTRLRVLTGSGVGIGGFIVTGNAPKRVIVRGIGPSLDRFGLAGVLADPVLELHGPGGFTTVINDNWQDTQRAEIVATGIPPIHNLESAIIATLPPGVYTAILRGKNGGIGLALIEIYDLDPSSDSALANLSTRAYSDTGTGLIIAGIIVGGGTANDEIIIRGIGPSLTALGVPNALPDPALEVRNADGTLLASNNNWQDVPAQAARITTEGLAPSNAMESAIYLSVPPGPITALLTDQSGTPGNGLLEIYDLAPPPPIAAPTLGLAGGN